MGHHHSKKYGHNTDEIFDHHKKKRDEKKSNDNDKGKGKGKGHRHSTESAHIHKTKKERSGSELIAGIKSDDEIGNALKQVPLFSSLSPGDRGELGGALLAQQFEEDQVIFEQGDPGEAFYIIVEGTVSVDNKYQGDDGQIHTRNISKLTAGDYFGEASLLTHEVRGATVTAKGGPVLAMTLERAMFEALFISKHIVVNWATRRAAMISERLSQKAPELLVAVDEASKQKNADDEKLIEGAVADNIFFMDMDEEHRKKIIKEMYKVKFDKDSLVLKNGTINYYFYVVAEGKFSEENSDHPEWGDKPKIHESGSAFGDIALMHITDNHSQVKALETSVCWAIDRFKFQSISKDLGEEKYHRYCAFLKEVETLNVLSSFERSKIAEALEEVTFEANATIMTKGEQGDSMYIVESGEAVVFLVDDEGNHKESTTCQKGTIFGERALAMDEPRAATVKAGTAGCVCVQIDRATFGILLGPLSDIFKKRIASYEKKPPRKREWKPIQIERSDLKNCGTLGKGSFGFVTLEQDKRNPEAYYALKAVSKHTVVATKQQGHIMSEKETMCELSHPCLVNLVATFQTPNQLFFLLEAGMGGDLFTVLRKDRLFPENTARFYAASVVAGFEFMHSCNTVYRDLKPENLLLDHVGYLKITDFGFAKKITGKTWTLCGTPEYLAPEIVGGKGHGFGVDWWTVGILVYELLVSYTPFYDRDQMMMYRKIARGNFHFPSQVSKDAKDLIRGLLTTNPLQRLGVTRGGAKTIRNHPFFSAHGFSFAKLVQRKLKPPKTPVLKTAKNLSREKAPTPTPYNAAKYGTEWCEGF